MARETLKTIFHPFESGTIAMPEAGRCLFLGAEPGYRVPEASGAVPGVSAGKGGPGRAPRRPRPRAHAVRHAHGARDVPFEFVVC